MRDWIEWFGWLLLYCGLPRCRAQCSGKQHGRNRGGELGVLPNPDNSCASDKLQFLWLPRQFDQ
jgi:hypothetical protein